MTKEFEVRQAQADLFHLVTPRASGTLLEPHKLLCTHQGKAVSLQAAEIVYISTAL
jgi:hypothetical protein